MPLVFYYFAVLVPLVILDAVWILILAKSFYTEKLGFLFSNNFNLVPAGLFYPTYALALLLLTVLPAVSTSSWIEALWRGALFGLAAYATYDLTNQTTIANWPTIVTMVDIGWGVLVTTLTSVIAYFIITALK